MQVIVRDNFIGANAISEKIMMGMNTAVTTAANDIKASAIPVTPLDDGGLRGSARVDINTTGKAVEAEISFNTEYAKRVHEGKSDSGAPIENWTTPGTKENYLGATFQSHYGAIYGYLVGHINRSLNL